ncbi:MAG: hypothetical protein R2682_01915 [Pyrinomonadaceae bacterium]
MNSSTAKKWAKRIFDEFDERIVEATTGTNVPPAFLAGLIFNEAGKDRAGNIVADATRFEKDVYNELIAVRDGRLRRYNRIMRADIGDASDDAIRALATSYQATQIMGWHVIHNLGCTIADLRDPKKHLFYTVRLLQLNGFPRNATDARMADEMRQWNTGREDGKTYHETYVSNAKAIRDAYQKLEVTRPAKVFISAAAPAQADSAQSVTEDDAVKPLADGEPSSTEQPPTPSIEGGEAPANSNSFDVFVPQIDTAKSWLKRSFSGLSLATIAAWFLGVPMWLQVALLGLLLAVVIGGIVIFVRYYREIFDFFKHVNTLRADPRMLSPNVKGGKPSG